MRSYYALSNEDLAELFVGARGVYLPTTPEALEGDVERHLRAGRMIHRLPDVPEIARVVRHIAAELADEPATQQIPSPEQVAWEQQQMQGIGDQPAYPEIAPQDMRSQLANFLMSQ